MKLLTATVCHLPCGITAFSCHPIQVNTSGLNLSQRLVLYLICLSQRDGRLSWP